MADEPMRYDECGALHVTFEYPNLKASEPVMRRAFAKAGGLGLSLNRYRTWDGRPYITVLGEDNDRCRRGVATIRRILHTNGGVEVATPPDALTAQRNKRWRKYEQAAATGHLRDEQHVGDDGAFLMRDGRVIRRGQG